MLVIAILLVLCGLLSLLLAAAVLLRGKQLSHLLFAGMASCIAVWALFVLLFLNTQSAVSALLYAKAYYLAATIFPVLFLIFALIHPRSRTISRLTMASIITGGTVVFIPLAVLPTFITHNAVISPSGNYIVVGKASYLLFATYFGIYFYAGIAIALRKYARYQGNEKIQAGAYAMGLLINSLPGIVTNLILPYFHNYRYIWVGPIGSVSFLGLTFYSILRHNMFDIRLVIARSLTYITSLLILASSYGFLIFGATQLLFDIHLSLGVQAFLSCTAALVAISFHRLQKLFDRLTRNIFYQDAYEPQKLFDELNQILVKTADLKLLLEQSSALLAATFKAEYCLFVVNHTDYHSSRLMGTAKPPKLTRALPNVTVLATALPVNVIAADFLRADHADLRRELITADIAVLARLMQDPALPGEGFGYLALGMRKSGNPYSKQDIRILETVVNELIIAVQNALHFEAIQNFNVTLQQNVDDATRELRLANTKLKALDETKDDFISMASHQLRTPLTSIKGYLSMVLEEDAGKITGTQHKMLNQAYVSSQRMVYLIADLLNVSRLKTGTFVVEASPVNLADLIAEEINQLQESAAGRGLQLHYTRPADFPLLMLDETKTRQVIMNFIDNAIYYTPATGSISIELQATEQIITFQVHDTGIGVPTAEQHQLFTKFYRAGNAQRERPDGTGLGLFMAKKIIAVQGGKLLFSSTEGKGSSFGFSFSRNRIALR